MEFYMKLTLFGNLLVCFQKMFTTTSNSIHPTSFLPNLCETLGYGHCSRFTQPEMKQITSFLQFLNYLIVKNGGSFRPESKGRGVLPSALFNAPKSNALKFGLLN